MQIFVLFGILLMTYAMLIAKRTTALIRAFRYQALLLGVITLLAAMEEAHLDLYIIATLIFVVKTWFIPKLLFNIRDKIKVPDTIGCLINPQLSLLSGLIFTYAAWRFAYTLLPANATVPILMLTICFTVTLIGLFLMVFRVKALTQTIGLLVMENGLFLLAASIAGGMPFFVEIALCLDILVSVIILNVFTHRINKLFTHIDVTRLTKLKG